MNYSTDFKSIRNDVSAQEWQARLDLAACYRLVDAYGMTDFDLQSYYMACGLCLSHRINPISKARITWVYGLTGPD